MGLSWDDLAGHALARQFPAATLDVPDAVAAIGPMQTQTARSAFLGLAARFPGTTHAQVTEAYDDGVIVRGSTIRGTVHTASPGHYSVLAEATRIGQHPRWARVLGVTDEQLVDLFSSVEAYAREWRTPEELRLHLVDWLAEHSPATRDAAEEGPGRYLAFGHGGLVRRPASGDRWEGQGKPVYRTFDRTAAATTTDVVRLHLASHGPSSRHDIAWWAGVPLRVVDEALDGLDVIGEDGPDGRTYLDLPGSPPPRDLPGARLLPEFDALMCGYDPPARERFADPAHLTRLWSGANGLVMPPLLVDGRITGYWRANGSARRRPLEVTWFARTRRPRRDELDEPVAALEAVLGITVSSVTITRELV
ncbi:winged helix DNA-binding domain-containing protein [Nocardioides KLBMP 9356]|uniref:Winged helix DNA-binding domain-containing protein n=1 Tax=Nocardioides potassii TaxID=2911371 RepID=A0ABS9HHM5_9ACTN|nr:crosslink repair DNA glycosylase YcaQ family protein [Nocardioides potassii]MCF6379626.1 winged helix DNA-binding domain-containing protein [Nocardioides potassii]